MRWRMLAAVVVGLLWLGTPVSWAQPTPTPELGIAPDIAAREARECTIPPDQPVAGRSLWNANLWPGGIVPYEFDANVTAGNQALMRQAMDVLEAAAYVRFVPRTGQPDALHIQNSNGNSSYVGTIGGVQPVNIFNWNFRYIMVHELMHALGVWHEQMRPDRDQYITVNYQNIQPGWGSQYDIIGGTTPHGPFDFDSVMLYGACSASVCCPANSNCACSGSNCWTMTALPAYAQYQGLMGNRTHLSDGDIAGLASRYGDPTPLTWTRKGEHPGVMAGHAMAYDSGRGLTVVCAGSTVWEWNGVSWSRKDGPGPSPRTNAALAYDSARGVTVLFGGTNEFGYVGETWEWNGTAWTQRMVSGPPIASDSVMAYDSARQVCVLFGGKTWEWNGTAWTERAVPGPSIRSGHTMAYDATRGVTVLFGGDDGLSAFFDDTWEWNGAAWTQRSVSGPVGRSGACIVHDAARGVMVLYGGYETHYEPGTGSVQSYFNDTWEWNGTTWSLRTPTTNPEYGRSDHAMAYHAATGETIMFGGIAFGLSEPNTWVFDGNDWEQKEFTLPSPRLNHAMAFDALRGVTVLFGGNTEGDTINGETWEWNGAVWRQLLVSGPSPRYSHAMAFDAARGVTVLYGGYTNNGYSGETWEWNGTAWTQRFDPTPPPVLRNHAMAYDSDRGVIVMFGGYTGSVYSDSTWEWNGTDSDWTVRLIAAPSARYYHAMAYDTLRHTMVLFAGGTNSNPLGDTWELGGAEDWSLVATGGPSARYIHAMVFDAAEGKAVMFGGYNDVANNAETWTWDGTAWAQEPATGPSPRRNHAMAYDSLRGNTVMFGGRSDFDLYDSETWELSGPCSPPLISDQPDAQRIYAAGTATFEVGATGSNPRFYQWSVRLAGFGSWVPLVNGNNPGIGVVQGANAALVMVTVAPELPTGTEFRCTVTNDCSPGTITSTAATLSVCLCPADFNCDGAVDFFDYDDFVVAFESGDPRADFDADGTVDFFDYDAFVVAFEVVC